MVSVISSHAMPFFSASAASGTSTPAAPPSRALLSAAKPFSSAINFAHPVPRDGMPRTAVTARAGRRASSTSSSGGKKVNNKAAEKKLTAISGVGRKTATILRDNGIPDLPSLRAWYADRTEIGNEELVATLCRLENSSEGSLRTREASKVVGFLRPDGERAAAEEEAEVSESHSEAGLRKAGKGLTLCVEGNIGVGKTTFLQKLIGQSVELQEVVEVVPEPVEQWQSVGNENVNLLDLFYNDQRRYAYTFQHYVFVTRVMQEKNSRDLLETLAKSEDNKKSLRLLERSVFSDRMVFVRAVHEAKCMSDVELSIYDSWFSPMVSALPTLIPDGFIYLKADPRTCLERMSSRARSEEVGVSLDYLENLHSKHEDWLAMGQLGERPDSKSLLFPGGELPYSNLQYTSSNMPEVPEILASKLVHMSSQGGSSTSGGAFLPSELNNVPALVLDYNTDIDFDEDTEARREYAVVVKAYMQYIKKFKQAKLSPGLIIPGSPLLSGQPSMRGSAVNIASRI